MTRNYSGNFIIERDIAVQNVQSIAAQAIASEAPSQPIKMEVGIEECLHIDFEYDKQKYHLNDVILGKIYFLLVRIKIKHMELAVIRREAAGTGSNTYNDSENITKYELMDGAPVKGECVPIRLFLSPLDLTPTYRSVNNIFSVKYYLNLVLVDEEDRRYFKQQEVVFWRKGSDAVGITTENTDRERGIRSL
jgi:vacuolar protein sorting-associated protein 26